MTHDPTLIQPAAAAPEPRRPSAAATAALALAVGIVLADSAIVTLALPAILREMNAEVSQVAWVLTAFNLALAIVAVPAARIASRGSAGTAGAAGLIVFAVASAACALAGNLEVLIGARVAQALGGAFVIAACLELLVDATGDERRGISRWVAAGVAGSAVGPVAGGLLTEAISWQSIFFVQVPLVLLAVPAALAIRGTRHEDLGEPADRPDIAANLALALISAALTAALFLLVLLLVEGWQQTPAVAALTVTAIPIAAVLAGPLARAAGATTRAEAIAGSVLVGGGLAALGLLPAAELVWTIPAQILVGFGLGLTVDSLTQTALHGRRPRPLHGGWTIAARHGGIVVGLLVLTPIFSADLKAAPDAAQESVAAQVLDSSLSASSKLSLATSLEDQLAASDGEIPELGPAFERAQIPADQAGEAQALEARITNQVERAATSAFRTAFLAAAVIALLAIAPALFLRERTAEA